MRNELTKSGVAEYLAEQASLSIAEATQQLNAVLNALEASLGQTQKIVLKGFGTFEVKDRAARTGRHPRTGEAMEIGPSKAITFKAGKNLKARVQDDQASKPIDGE